MARRRKEMQGNDNAAPRGFAQSLLADAKASIGRALLGEALQCFATRCWALKGDAMQGLSEFAAAAPCTPVVFGRNHIERLRPAGKAARLRQRSLANAQADAQVECEKPMNNLSDRRPQRPWNADKPEISTGSQQTDQRDGWRNGQIRENRGSREIPAPTNQKGE